MLNIKFQYLSKIYFILLLDIYKRKFKSFVLHRFLLRKSIQQKIEILIIKIRFDIYIKMLQYQGVIGVINPNLKNWILIWKFKFILIEKINIWYFFQSCIIVKVISLNIQTYKQNLKKSKKKNKKKLKNDDYYSFNW